MIKHLTLAVVFAGTAVGGQEASQPVTSASVVQSDLLVRYRFTNPRFVISEIAMTIDGAGRGRLTWTRRDLNGEQSREVIVTELGMTELRGLLERLDFVNSKETYQTKEDHSNLGETKVRVGQAGVEREVTFNYTKNRDADALGRFLRGIANREMFVAELELAIAHQPLETPAAIATLAQEYKYGRIGDAVALVPLLNRIADDPALPLIARNKASELAGRISTSSQR